MKKTLVIMGIFICIVIMGIYYNFAPSKKIIPTSDHMIFNSLEELENNAELIAVCKPTKEFSSYMPDITYNPKGFIENYFTTVDIEIQKVIKGHENKGDIINITQRAAYLPSRLKKNKDLMIIEDVTLLQKDKIYILYLKKIGNSYQICSLDQGKFNVDGKDDEENTHEQSDKQYRELKNKVKDKYGIYFN